MIDPVFTAEEWQNLPDSYALCVEWDGHEPKIMALANASLPDDSPYKITQADVETLRIAASHLDMVNATSEAEMLDLAERLAALLPP